MSIMITPPQNEDFQALLAEYMREPEDIEFTDAVMIAVRRQAALEARQGKVKRLRIGALLGSCFMGGVMAASQLKSVLALSGDITLPQGPLMLIPLFVLFGFVVWMTLDNKMTGSI